MVGLVALAGCSKRDAPEAASLVAAPAPVAAQDVAGAGAAKATSPSSAVAAQAALPATARKVIRNAELSIEVRSPAAVEEKVSRLIEGLGGYVASADQNAARVNLTLRVPVQGMDQALREIKQLGDGAQVEKLGSEDVTDEYIDLDAHITNQRRLETQMATFLAQSTNVETAMKVHKELTAVRTEIDRLEGRKRFLGNEAAMSKIALSLTQLVAPPPVIAVAPVTFYSKVKDAAHESVETASAVTSTIVIVSIHALGMLLPMLLIFGLPTLAVLWLLRRRQRKILASA